MPVWESLGAHRYYREADLAFFELHGEIFLDEIQVVFAISDSQEAEYGYALTLFDARAGTSFGPEARRFVGDRSRTDKNIGASAIIGASFAIRTIVQLLNNATRLFGKRVAPIYFCATPEEAMKWIAVQRTNIIAAHAKPTSGRRSAV